METVVLTSDNLIAGDFPRVEKSVTIEANEPALKRGTVLALTGSGTYRKFNVANSDGSEILASDPLVLAQDVPLSATDTTGVLTYVSGEFNKQLVQDAAHTNKVFDADELMTLRDKGIYLNAVYGTTT